MENSRKSRRKRAQTIFKQLIFNVIFPVVVALIMLASLNYYQTKSILTESNNTKNQIISNEIKHIMELQDIALEAIEEDLDEKMAKYSHKLVNKLKNVENIKEADLDEIRKEMGMTKEHIDIYVINREGVVVNTTFDKDLNLNFFDFGEDHKQHLLHIFEEGEYLSERFAVEASTKRMKKYTYHPTPDKKYIIELGAYSKKADELINQIQNILAKIAQKESEIQNVALFISEENPFSLSKNIEITDEEYKVLLKAFETKEKQILKTKQEKKTFYHEFIYMERENTDLYKASVIRIVSDRSRDEEILLRELIKSIVIFVITILIVMAIIYVKTRIITNPIKRLVENVNRISKGDLTDRALIEGSNEIATLSKHFNRMIERLEEYYNELEQKVADRTREIEQQKEEITAQRDSLADKNNRLEAAYHKIELQNQHITDSIQYARQIQRAVLPPYEYIDKLFPESFVLFRPKDIVSGDFYWAREVNGFRVLVAADCTGHGVPGAFMSLLSMSSLNEIVTSETVDNAGAILDDLREYIKKSLRQTGKEGEQKDGIDLSICVYNPDKEQLDVAGANNSLVLIRDNEVQIIKADRMPIGIYRKEFPFTNHTIDIKKDDVVYMFSDGYPDQFGGPKGRKFLAKKFRQVLHEIHQMPLNDQKAHLETTLVEWMEGVEQVDDILVVGIKF